MNVKKKLPGKMISLKNIKKGRQVKRSKTEIIFFLAKFRCHGSEQDAGEEFVIQKGNPRRYPGYYTH